MSQVYIVSGCRTAVGSFQGQFEKFTAAELGAVTIAEAIKRANLEPKDVEQVIMGQVLTAGYGQNPARQAALSAQIPVSSSAYTINMLCGSGIKTVALGFQAIRNGDCNVVVAGGQESMTRAHHSAYIRGNKFGHLNLNDTLLVDGLTDAFDNILMGKTAEHCAKQYNISREAQDEFSYHSQRKTEEAVKNGLFSKEIIGVTDKKTGKILDKDEYPKPGTTVEQLAKLKAAFETGGTVTAGNASGINDGAAAVVLSSEQYVKEKKLKPLARILAFAEVGVEPICMGLGPIGAITKVLNKLGWTKDDVDLYEINEAYAALSIIVNESLGLDPSKVNVTGGALALGHPLACSGTKILVTLIYNLLRLGKTKGVTALCIGGGMGIAMAVEIC